MTTDDFKKFILAFRRQFLRDSEPWEFLLGWEKKLSGWTLAEVERAVAEVAADPRIVEKSHPAAFVHNRLPLLIEWLRESRERKSAQQVIHDLHALRQRAASESAA